jgi:hypothetical protein
MLRDLAEEVIAHLPAEPLGHRLVLRHYSWLPLAQGETKQVKVYTTFFEAKAVSVGGKVAFMARNVPCLSVVAGQVVARAVGVPFAGIPDKADWLCVVAPDEKKFRAYFCSYLRQVEAYSARHHHILYECWLTEHAAPYKPMRDLHINDSLYRVNSNVHDENNKRFDEALSLMQVLRASPRGPYAWASE